MKTWSRGSSHRRNPGPEQSAVPAERGQLAAWGVQVEASGLLFTEIDGNPLHPDRFRKRFKRLAAKVEWEQDGARRVGLPPIRLHDVRHTYATVALQAGVPVKGSASDSATPPSR
ncbi:MAG TPA: hypothetical protein VGC06_01995 [Actinomycetes bacterium]